MSEQTKPEVKKTVNNDPNSWKAREKGCYWIGDNNKLNIHIKNKDGNVIKFVAFPNKFKEEGSNQPDGRIYTDIKDYQGSNSTTTKPAPKVVKEPVVEKAAVAQTETAPDF
ncbi:MAG: hypothetical protein Q7R95_02370 [bacterium]|nr:hypothetical protein [bacterium]